MATEKKKGRIGELVDVLKLVLKRVPFSWLWLSLSFLLPLAGGIVFAVISADVISAVVWVIGGILLGLLVFLIVLGQITQRLMYQNLEGQIGAVSALIKNQLRRSWRASEIPVRMNKSSDTVYRLVGRPGVVIISEGVKTRVAPLVDEARREAARIVPSVPIHTIHVGADGLKIGETFKSMYKLKSAIKMAEVRVVSNRLNSIAKTPMSQMPKGIDPTKIRSARPR
ncbi:MAG: DUF4191 family protein [Actinobacteria bacterium]|jgi:hypothetical protein|uniref:Unannotated protein n=1 Tax=freshwater metagenome TaxID=449393 RepID=A0A6J6FSB5_9ZZZZ|nr:DUF4191 family protein [Actinomycetota bacterium]